MLRCFSVGFVRSLAVVVFDAFCVVPSANLLSSVATNIDVGGIPEVLTENLANCNRSDRGQDKPNKPPHT